MAIHLVTDFGLEGPYTGQVLARLHAEAPGAAAFSLFADAPAFDAKHSAYLVAAYGKGVNAGDVLLCVVDPGVGTERAGLVLHADGRWYVGPDNGLLAIAAAQARAASWWRLDPPPSTGPQTFHGRDWFAPAAARLARGGEPSGVASARNVVGADWPRDLPEIVYIDHYGNAMTGLRSSAVPKDGRLRIGDRRLITPGSIFAASAPAEAFWYANANGLVEIAVNRERADLALGLRVGAPVEICR